MSFHLHIAALAKWFLAQVGSAVFSMMCQKLSADMGLSPLQLTSGGVKTHGSLIGGDS